jgi:glycosyltransferase involved in cell wall biosynthesis
MLSILIPTYNYNIVKLAKDLHHQALEQLIDFEIIIMEDGSSLYVDGNCEIKKLSNCQYILLEDNIGRSAIRNKLADYAKFEHLLFMDCDAEVCSLKFIEKYLGFCNEECVVIGGTAYDPNEHNPNFSLRLKYGRMREARTALERTKNNFSTFNFLISKSIFNRVRFDEDIRGYGHEDMLFGHQIHQLGYEFIQIDNPLIHRGLDDNSTFIRKTEEGTKNLFLLYQTGSYPYLTEESKLLRIFSKIKKMGLVGLFALKFDTTKKMFRILLCRKSPSLFLYDFYKILFLCKTSIIK